VTGEHEVIRLERQLLEPAHRRDAAFVASVLHPGFVEYGSSGRVWSREETVEALAADPSVGGEADGFEAHPLGDQVVLVTYRTTGALRSSIWIREEAGWQIRFHQGTPGN
jgi:ribonuclease HI